MISATHRTLAVVACTLALSGCPKERRDQPAQSPAAREEVKGTITDGLEVRAQAVVGKGTVGLTRESFSTAAGAYALSLTELAGPYVLGNTLSPTADPSLIVLTSVATRSGVVNITPLTTLLTAQVLGVAPGNAFATFNTGTGVSPALITDAAILSAQSDLAAFLKDVYDLDLGSSSYLDTPFTAVAGDPMFDAIRTLNEKLTQEGKTLAVLARDIANGSKACRTDLVQLNLPGAQRKFCPVFRSATADIADPAIIEYVFRDVSEDALTVRARDAQVLAAELEMRNGTIYTCSTIACTNIMLGTPFEDQSRPVTFGSAVLNSASGSAMLSGTMQSAVPGVILPPLACAENLFYMVFEDRKVTGDCVSPSDPFQLGGTFGSDIGPGRTRWSLPGSSDPSSPSVEVVLDTSGSQPTVASIYYTDFDPDTFERKNVYVCQSAACSSVILGAPTVNTTAAPGYEITRRNISFDKSLLSGYTANGVSTGLTGQLTGSFTLLSTPNTLAWPAATACAPVDDAIEGQVSGTSFNICIPQDDFGNGYYYRYVYDNGDGTLQVLASSETGDQQVLVLLDNGAVTEVDAWVSGAQFSCHAGACAGVSLSAPDGDGDRRLSLASTVLRLQESFPLPGSLTLELTVTNLLVPLYQ